MTLSDYLKTLSYQAFSNLNAGNQGSGNFNINAITKVVSYLNEALTRIYTRFILETDTVFIDCDEGITNYVLTKEHTLSNAIKLEEPPKEVYILDSIENPFKDNVIKILDAFDAYTNPMPLNDPLDPNSVFVINYNTLQVPSTYKDKGISILYQANHLPLDYEKRPDQEIKIPPFLTGALTAYVAFLWYSDINTAEAVQNAMKYQQIYEAICQEVIQQDLSQTTYATVGNKLHKRGFV